MKRKRDYTALIAVAFLFFLIAAPTILNFSVVGYSPDISPSNPIQNFINSIITGFNSFFEWLFGS